MPLSSTLRAFAPLILLALALASCERGNDLSTEQLSRVVEANRHALKPCYDAALKQHPYKHEMQLQAIIGIAPTGRVTSLDFEGGGGLPGMTDCLRDVIRSWTFPQAEVATRTSLPLIFKPEVVRPKPDVETLKQVLQQAAAE